MTEGLNVPPFGSIVGVATTEEDFPERETLGDIDKNRPRVSFAPPVETDAPTDAD